MNVDHVGGCVTLDGWLKLKVPARTAVMLSEFALIGQSSCVLSSVCVLKIKVSPGTAVMLSEFLCSFLVCVYDKECNSGASKGFAACKDAFHTHQNLTTL